jgi:hypothetical protein
VVADLFEWTTDDRFDVVAFGFWLSHVPSARLGEFLRRVAGWLRPGGRVFYVDSLPYASRISPALVATAGDLHTRRLADGREFTIVKAFRPTDDLQAAFTDAGLTATSAKLPPSSSTRRADPCADLGLPAGPRHRELSKICAVASAAGIGDSSAGVYPPDSGHEPADRMTAVLRTKSPKWRIVD